jgi:glutamate-1-semialdehyde 2,1-aminomutase
VIESWPKSTEMLARASQSLTGGVSSPFRAKATVPLYFENGCGARLTDVDGNEYIDYVLAWGPMILGYRHPAIVDVMRLQADLPMDYGAQHELEILTSELFQKLVPCAERLTFCSSGSEAVHLVQRLARAHTGKNLILKFEGHYHGWFDTALISYKPTRDTVGPIEAPNCVLGSKGQVPNAVENAAVAPWNDIAILERIMDGLRGQIAAVMMEPVLCNSGCIMPAEGYLKQVRDLCDRHGCLLILDEVITGFRLSLGGAQQFFDVKPDLATFGKALGGGATVSAIAGREEIMMQIFNGGVSFGGSFNGNPVALASAHATLKELSRNNGAALQHANAMGERLAQGVRRLAGKHGVPLKVTGFGAAFALHFTHLETLVNYRDTFGDQADVLRRFLLSALRNNVHMLPDGRIYVSAAHTVADIDETLTNLDNAFAELNL